MATEPDAHLERAVRYLLKAALEAEGYAAELDPGEDGLVIDYYLGQSEMIRTLANEWSPQAVWKDNVVPIK